MREPTTEERLMQKGHELAQNCVMAGVLENQLALVLAHLKRHRNPQDTLELVSRLPKSPFGTRSGKTRTQFEKLELNVKRALGGLSDWQEAAQVVGWGKRLYSFYDRS